MFFTVITRILLFLNALFALTLGLSYLAPYVSPEKFWLLAFFGLAYPALLLINLIFVLFWAIRFKIYFLFSLIIIMAGWQQINGLVQLNISELADMSKKDNEFKVMSYNVRLFDLYNWTHNKETRNKIFNLVKDEAPDILCIQEFYVDDNKNFKTIDTLVEFQNAKNYHLEYTKTEKRIYHWGIVTFSKYPIINKGIVEFPTKSNNICIYSDIKVNDDTLRIYNMHLQSIQFVKKDYEFIDQMNTLKEAEESKNILRRLKKAFIKRAKQVELVAEHIKHCRYPVIVCGDFNDSPSSYSYHVISKNLNDAFIESGIGIGNTYVGPFPSFRIDYILHSPVLKSAQYRTIKQALSDHYPITCNVAF